MTTEPESDDALDPIWTERFRADLDEDSRSERRLFVKAVAIALLVAVLALARWILV